MAGQMIMQGFVGFRIPIWLRRLVTMVPAFVVVALGVNATKALVVSQVVLSFALPLPMIALLMFSSRADIMGTFVNPRLVTIVASTAMIVVLILNRVYCADARRAAAGIAGLAIRRAHLLFCAVIYSRRLHSRSALKFYRNLPRK